MLRDGHPKVRHGRRDADELRLVETIEHPLEQGGPRQLDIVEHLATGRGDAHEHDPAILRDADPFDEPPFLDPIHETRGGRE